jgi:hypothetical protein
MADDGVGGGIQVQRLVDDPGRVLEAFDVRRGDRAVADDRRDLVAYALLRVLMAGREDGAQGDARAGGLVAGEKEGQGRRGRRRTGTIRRSSAAPCPASEEL